MAAVRLLPAPCQHDDLTPTCELLRRLALTPAGPDSLTGLARGGRTDSKRVFGGFLAAQSLLAAAATVEEDRQPDSMHLYFLTPGNAEAPLDYQVTTLREGMSMSSRQVTASQDGTIRTTALLSFARVRSSPTHQRGIVAHPVPDEQEHNADLEGVVSGLDYRYLDHPDPELPTRESWLRCPHDLGDDPLWHAVMLAFASDLGNGRLVDMPHQHEPGRRRSASLDHAIWFHQAGRTDDWIEYRQQSPIYVEGRGLVQGELSDPSGRLIATVTQRMAISRKH
jgi:acyl-CoA thioesterase II